MEKSAFQVNMIRVEANQICCKCVSEVVGSDNISPCGMLDRDRTASDKSCLIRFATQGDFQCELIVDWQCARCPQPTPMVSHDTITVGSLEGPRCCGQSGHVK